MKTNGKLWVMRYSAVAGMIIFLLYIGCIPDASANKKKQGMNLYFVRHAETLANVTGEKTPENNRVITEKGFVQISELTQQLQSLNPDVILVSPTYRTMMTVKAFLESTNKVAQIWPELEEWRMEADPLSMLATTAENSQEIQIDPEFGLLVKFRDADSDKRYFARDFAGGIKQTEETARMIIKQYGQSGLSVLVVGHSNAGSRLLEALLGLDPTVRFKLEKAKISHLRQSANGRFQMMLLNGESYQE